jgi:menaquinone-dependent protoporphyrinogen oxidase
MGCLTAAGIGLTACGVSALLPPPEPAAVDLPTFTYAGGDSMDRLLVAYASGLGSTAEVAAAIGEALADGGLGVDVKPVLESPQPDGYQAVLIGSAVRHGSWLAEAVEYVRANREALNRVPVALFSVHITNLGDDENSRRNRLAFLDEVRPLLMAVDEAYFAGRFDRRGAALLMPGCLARFVPRMDLRNWEKIRTWAAGVQPRLVQKPEPGSDNNQP